MSQAIQLICTFITFAFACGFVGAGLGIAASRASRCERDSSWLGVLLGTVATLLFLAFVLVLYFGTYHRTVMPWQVRIAGVALALGVGFAGMAVIRMNYAAQAVIAASVATFLALFGTVVWGIFIGPTTPGRLMPYVIGTLLPAGVGALHGWFIAWRRDAEEFFDGAARRRRRAGPAGEPRRAGASGPAVLSEHPGR